MLRVIYIVKHSYIDKGEEEFELFRVLIFSGSSVLAPESFIL